MTVAEAVSKSAGATFYSLESFSIESQSSPRTAKNGKVFSVLNLQAGVVKTSLFLWDAAATHRIPSDTEVLRGSFAREDFSGSKNISCQQLTIPDGSIPFTSDEVQGIAGKPTIKEILMVGKRGYDWAVKLNLPESIQAEAFRIAAQAKMGGHPDQ